MVTKRKVIVLGLIVLGVAAVLFLLYIWAMINGIWFTPGIIP